MKKISKATLIAAAAAATGLFHGAAHAQQTWNVTEAIGSFNWNEDANWTPGPYPNAQGIVANVNNDITTPMTITIPGGDGIKVGVLNLGDSGSPPDQKFIIGTAPGGAGTFTFDNGPNDAQLNVAKDVTPGGISEFDQLGTNIFLNNNLVINTGPIFASTIRIRGKVSDGANGPKGLIVNGTGFAELQQAGEANTFSGLTIINSRLRLMSGGNVNLIAGDVQIQNGGVLQDGNANGNCISDTSNINVINGRYNNGGGSDTIGSLEGGNQGTVGGAGGTITFGGNGLDKAYNGIFNSEPSFIKTGTGVQTLGGTLASQVPDDSPANQSFSVLAGRLDLAKTAGLTSIAQRNLFVGDGTQAGALRPELRLLSDEQIQVNVTSSTTDTTPVTLNSGILNLNGHNETVGSLIVAGSGTSTLKGAPGLKMANGLTVNDTATLEAANDGTFNNVIKAPNLTIGATARIDLQNNKLITTGSVGTATAGVYGGLTGKIQSGRNGGNWSGNGIVTSQSTATTSNLTSIGIATAQQAKSLATPGTTAVWAGQTVTGSDALVMYTYGGDANLDGKINVDDYGRIDLNIPLGTSGWYNGDFNYDGKINVDDYGIIDFNVGIQGAPIPAAGGSGLSGVSAVPEPASVVSLLAACGVANLRRRRRGHA